MGWAGHGNVAQRQRSDQTVIHSDETRTGLLSQLMPSAVQETMLEDATCGALLHGSTGYFSSSTWCSQKPRTFTDDGHRGEDAQTGNGVHTSLRAPSPVTVTHGQQRLLIGPPANSCTPLQIAARTTGAQEPRPGIWHLWYTNVL
jgi:hypothetical protein